MSGVYGIRVKRIFVLQYTHIKNLRIFNGCPIFAHTNSKIARALVRACVREICFCVDKGTWWEGTWAWTVMVGGIFLHDIKAKRSETRLLREPPSPSAIISETWAKPAATKRKKGAERALVRTFFSPSSPFRSLFCRSYCLSLRFTFTTRYDDDGDVRFNKAPGMSCHVMHTIACEIYVNTAIRPAESVGVSHSLSSISRTPCLSEILT